MSIHTSNYYVLITTFNQHTTFNSGVVWYPQLSKQNHLHVKSYSQNKIHAK